jgi:hypothetical protein
MHATVEHAALLLPLDVVVPVKRCEAPVAGLHNLLASRELELGTAQGFCGLQHTQSHGALSFEAHHQ